MDAECATQGHQRLSQSHFRVALLDDHLSGGNGVPRQPPNGLCRAPCQVWPPVCPRQSCDIAPQPRPVLGDTPSVFAHHKRLAFAAGIAVAGSTVVALRLAILVYACSSVSGLSKASQRLLFLCLVQHGSGTGEQRSSEVRVVGVVGLFHKQQGLVFHALRLFVQAALQLQLVTQWHHVTVQYTLHGVSTARGLIRVAAIVQEQCLLQLHCGLCQEIRGDLAPRDLEVK